MSLNEEDFTSDDAIDSFRKGDHTINNSNKKVQIIGWNEFSSKLDNVRIGSIIYANALKYNIPKTKDYNSGNTIFQLMIEEKTEVQIFGVCSTVKVETLIQEVSVIEAYDNIGNKIKIDAVIKTESGIYKGKSFNSNVDSLTDTTDQVELKFNFDLTKLPKPLVKELLVEVTGVMERYKNGPPMLNVNDPNDIQILDRPRVAFVDVLMGFHTKQS